MDLKCPPQSDKSVFLNKTFKFFDIQNKGSITCDQFKRSIEKLGVVMPEDERDFDLIFKFYDRSNDGRIDYKELSKIFSARGDDSEPSLAQQTADYRRK